VQLSEPCDKTEANADPGGVGAHLLAPLECSEDRFFEVVWDTRTLVLDAHHDLVGPWLQLDPY
jgi:hypothetical protein